MVEFSLTKLKDFIFRGRSSIGVLLVFPLLTVIIWNIGFHWKVNLPENTVTGFHGVQFSNGTSIWDRAPIFLSYSKYEDKEPQFGAVIHFTKVLSGCNLVSAQQVSGLNGTFGLAVDGLDYCYPEQIAKEAQKSGYDFVLFGGPYKDPGYSSVSIWRTNDAPIPIYEGSRLDDDMNIKVEDLHNLTIDISPTDNPFQNSSNVITLVIFALFNGFLGLLQLIRSWERSKGHIHIKTLSKNNARSITCVIQIVSGALRILFSFDILQVFHVYNYATFRILLALAFMFIFQTIYLVAMAYHVAIIKVSQYENNFKSVKSFWFFGIVIALMMIFELVSAIASILPVPGTGNLQRISLINAILVQVVSGAYFIFMKVKVLANLKSTLPTGVQKGNKRVGDVTRMSSYLYTAVVPMIGFIVSIGLGIYYIRVRRASILSLILAAMFTAITELTLVCSFPKRKGGQSSFRPTAAGSADAGYEPRTGSKTLQNYGSGEPKGRETRDDSHAV